MTRGEAHDILKRFQQWRRDNTGEVAYDFTSKQLGAALDMAIDALEDETLALCDVQGCKDVVTTGGAAWRDTGYWSLCSKHHSDYLRGKPQPVMNAEAVEREKKRCPSCGSNRLLDWPDGTKQCRLCWDWVE
jgi:hypothetical protein